MKVIENLKVKEKIYVEKLNNGLNVIIIPKKDIKKKYMIWGTNYRSNDNKFVVDNEVIEVPNGVAHFLEHKLFEQENGINSLDKLTSLGVEANAYTTNDHTAYLFECTDNFYEAMTELMDYVQHPYFTDENVEKEKGIIGQEIMMYDDLPEWKVYLNALKAMYHKNPIKIDITGTIETIGKIDKEILYKCYNTFYIPSNMLLVICGDFEPEKIIHEIEERLIKKEEKNVPKRIYPNEPETIAKSEILEEHDVSQPIYAIGIKDKIIKDGDSKTLVKRHIAIEILLNLLIGKSSSLYKKLYNKGTLHMVPNFDYEFSKTYAHILISGYSKDPYQIYRQIKNEIEVLKKDIKEEDVERIKKTIYGGYIREYENVSDVSRMFLADYFKGVNSFDYLEEIWKVDLEFLKEIIENVFKEDKMVISVVKK